MHPIRGKIRRFDARNIGGISSAGGYLRFLAFVRPYRQAFALVSADTLCCRVDAEPVVSRGLIGRNDNVVALSDVHQEAVCEVRLDGDKVRRDDLHCVVVQRYAEELVH